ncbi:MAG: response regulator transcription factor [Lactobacillus sp.]|jgi:DNA-binding response OmpR family regulator|nr:response regulator transcription factor [Lactobacillus sp.]
MATILIVEDDQDLNHTVTTFLRQHDFQVYGALSAEAAYDLMYKHQFDLIISDIMMPDIDGFEFAETVRKLNENIPIIFMTARDDIGAKQRGFRVGIDDYMVKPIDLDEMVLRIGALFRRAKIQTAKQLTLGNFRMDVDERLAYYQDVPIEFTLREFDLVYKLLSYPKKTFTRGQLMDEFWDADTNTSTRTVDVYMTKIREKLHDVTEFQIVTVRGLGYKAVPNE